MNFGLIARYALSKSELPDDASHLDVAKNELNIVIEELWYRNRSKYRQSRGQIVTIADCDEYLINKYFDEFVKYTLQGPDDNPRFFYYLEPEEFFRRIHLQDDTSGDPYIFTFGDLVGFDAQLTSASQIRVYSSLANKTSDSVNFVAGSNRVTSSTSLFTFNDVGLYIKKDGDAKSYRIGKYISETEIELESKYRGTTESSASYALGDIGVRVNITGYVAGQIQSEDIELNGSTVAWSTKTFNTLVSISKSGRTGGSITCTDSASVVTVGTMAPGETEIERQTVLLWPKPDGAETLQYRFFMKHPTLWLDSDRLLIRSKWHGLVQAKLEVRLLEWAGKQVPPALAAYVVDRQGAYDAETDDLYLTDTSNDPDRRHYGDRFFYDKDEDLYL